MNLLLISPEELNKEGVVTFRGERLKEVREQLEYHKGGAISIGIFNGKWGEGVILQDSPEEMSVKCHLLNNPPNKLPLTLAVGVCRPQIAKRVIQQATSLGIKEIIFFGAENTFPSYFSSKVYEEKGIRENIILGLQQSVDTVFPEVHFLKKSWEWQKAFKSYTKVMVADQSGSREIFPSELNHQNVLCVIGPERGFSPEELSYFSELKAQKVSFGERVLRVDTAIPFLIGKMNLSI